MRLVDVHSDGNGESERVIRVVLLSVVFFLTRTVSEKRVQGLKYRLY